MSSPKPHALYLEISSKMLLKMKYSIYYTTEHVNFPKAFHINYTHMICNYTD